MVILSSPINSIDTKPFAKCGKSSVMLFSLVRFTTQLPIGVEKLYPSVSGSLPENKSARKPERAQV
jgi:hypothetical protein